MRDAITFLLGWVSAVSTAVAIVLFRDLILHRRQFDRRQIRAARVSARPALPTLYFRDVQPDEETSP